MESTIRLFKAVPVKTKKVGAKELNDALMQKTIPMGFVFAPEVVAEYSDTKHLIKMVDDAFGHSPEMLNASFHKSWKKVAEADIKQLVLEQLMHYFTTYGFERMGIYHEESVFVPREELDIPALKEENIQLVVIRGLTKEELKEKLMGLLGLGIALAEDTKKDVLDVAIFVGMNLEDIKEVKNKEVKVALYDYLNLFPENPTEFLRFVVYKATNETLLIKNRNLVEKIKEKDNLSVAKMFDDYNDKYGLEPLAGIFYRFKPLFLAFRVNKRLKVIINRIRRLAVKHHRPMPEDYLNSVTARLSDTKRPIMSDELKSELDKVNTFRKIRLAYALNYRTKDVGSILYRVRSGRGYAKEFNSKPFKTSAKLTLGIVMDSIVADIKKNLDGKKVFYPEGIEYALPATEKQYTGHFPSGTYVSMPSDMMVGVNWKNQKDHRIDLDLSMISLKTGKMGWDGFYRNQERSVLFSGDITDASGKNGATELFYLKKQEENEFILFLNYYNYDDAVPVPYKIIVASENTEKFKENYVVDPNNLVAVASTIIDVRQKVLGLVVTSPEESRFYFAETNIGGSISSYNSEYGEHTRNYLFGFYKDAIYLRDILEELDVLVDNLEDADIDLTPENLEKDSILNCIKGTQK